MRINRQKKFNISKVFSIVNVSLSLSFSLFLLFLSSSLSPLSPSPRTPTHTHMQLAEVLLRMPFPSSYHLRPVNDYQKHDNVTLAFKFLSTAVDLRDFDPLSFVRGNQKGTRNTGRGEKRRKEEGKEEKRREGEGKGRK